MSKKMAELTGQGEWPGTLIVMIGQVCWLSRVANFIGRVAKSTDLIEWSSGVVNGKAKLPSRLVIMNGQVEWSIFKPRY